jgi:hypothetical protein
VQGDAGGFVIGEGQCFGWGIRRQVIFTSLALRAWRFSSFMKPIIWARLKLRKV